MRRTTFENYQKIYLEFINMRASTNCSQAEFCRQTGILPMTLSRAAALAAKGDADFTRPFPEDGPNMISQPSASVKRQLKGTPVEFVELVYDHI